MSDQTDTNLPPAVCPTSGPDWSAWLPDWGRRVVVVLERDTELSACLASEFRLSQHTELRLTQEEPLEFVSVSGPSAALQLIRDRVVIGLILNLESHCRESLVLLRQLLGLNHSPDLAAVGTVAHEELRSVLFEAGCPLLVTDPPFDVVLAAWLNRILRHKHAGPTETIREGSETSQKNR